MAFPISFLNDIPEAIPPVSPITVHSKKSKRCRVNLQARLCLYPLAYLAWYVVNFFAKSQSRIQDRQ